MNAFFRRSPLRRYQPSLVLTFYTLSALPLSTMRYIRFTAALNLGSQ